MLMKQVELSKNNTKQVCWVDQINKIKVGCLVELKDKSGLWRIDKIFDNIIDRQDLNHSWHVGGL